MRSPTSCSAAAAAAAATLLLLLGSSAGAAHQQHQRQQQRQLRSTAVVEDVVSSSTRRADQHPVSRAMHNVRRALREEEKQEEEAVLWAVEADNNDHSSRRQLEEGGGENEEQHEKVPHKLWFTHPTNLLEDRQPPLVYDNVMKIIMNYRRKWPDVAVRVLTDDVCRQYIEEMESELLPYFDGETSGTRKSEICRLAVLLKEGGYYFDTDLEYVRLMRVKGGPTSFVGVQSCGGRCFNTGFLATQPGHELFRLALGEQLRVYSNGLDPVSVGAVTLNTAYHEHLPDSDKVDIKLLEEIQLEYEPIPEKRTSYKDVDRQAGHGTRCNVAIHDPIKSKVYFYSNFVGSNTCRRGLIPQKIHFTHTFDILERPDESPVVLLENVQNTADQYKNMWQNDEAVVKVWDDEHCRTILQTVNHKLIPFFDGENDPTHKADICRLAVLYQYGGFFFDTDWKVVKPYQQDDGVAFVTVKGCGGGCFDTGFVAATAKNPILERNLRKMSFDYENGEDTTMVGPVTMANAYYDLNTVTRGPTTLLDEGKLDLPGDNEDGLQVYPDVPRQIGSGDCNSIIHDRRRTELYFYTHLVGYGVCEAPPSLEGGGEDGAQVSI